MGRRPGAERKEKEKRKKSEDDGRAFDERTKVGELWRVNTRSGLGCGVSAREDIGRIGAARVVMIGDLRNGEISRVSLARAELGCGVSTREEIGRFDAAGVGDRREGEIVLGSSARAELGCGVSA